MVFRQKGTTPQVETDNVNPKDSGLSVIFREYLLIHRTWLYYARFKTCSFKDKDKGYDATKKETKQDILIRAEAHTRYVV